MNFVVDIQFKGNIWDKIREDSWKDFYGSGDRNVYDQQVQR